ncbi:hypothetical protein U0070_010922 [Myodes glareolus]|uniref:Cytochrome b-c1 complex subunit 7 n=1 Tax=Myodes glareolus TaxID=447135 RepID=A0AAW0HZX3_MYOGA
MKNWLLWQADCCCSIKQVAGWFSKWYYNAAGFNKLGSVRDDTPYETEGVQEAVRRLPEDLYNDRMFQIKKALVQILSKEQWTEYEEDKSLP